MFSREIKRENCHELNFYERSKTYQCWSIRNKWLPPTRFRPTPPALSDTNITYETFSLYCEKQHVGNPPLKLSDFAYSSSSALNSSHFKSLINYYSFLGGLIPPFINPHSSFFNLPLFTNGPSPSPALRKKGYETFMKLWNYGGTIYMINEQYNGHEFSVLMFSRSKNTGHYSYHMAWRANNIVCFKNSVIIFFYNLIFNFPFHLFYGTLPFWHPSPFFWLFRISPYIGDFGEVQFPPLTKGMIKLTILTSGIMGDKSMTILTCAYIYSLPLGLVQQKFV